MAPMNKRLIGAVLNSYFRFVRVTLDLSLRSSNVVTEAEAYRPYYYLRRTTHRNEGKRRYWLRAVNSSVLSRSPPPVH